MSTDDRLRLKSIKLAGFKSFVDPTNVPFPSQLTAIVGPNGCGKSNIIDAVRWVMGESSAKYLRGDSITDVIFNGSSARKPVGQASVELIFDNPNGALGGEYAQFSEISIKRVVNREAQSTYFLNNTRCRRRDIVQVFLGTGLGPRSYAIIEQGMISRLIEAKPEELRNKLEEAAEISKYKERRRETENRMRHTRENLERLTDIREELGKQLARLQRQANAAARYKVLKQEERTAKAQLLAMRWKNLDGKIKQFDSLIRELEIELESVIAKQTDADKGIEQIRQLHIAATDESNQVQEVYYSVGAEVSRIEQSLQHHKERRQQLQEDLADLAVHLQQNQLHMSDDQTWLSTTAKTINELTPQADTAQAKADNAREQLLAAEASMQDWQQQWDEFNQQSSTAQQQAQVQQTRIQHLEQTMQKASKQIAKMQQEKQQLDSQPFENELAELKEKQSNMLGKAETFQASLKQTREHITEHKQQIDGLSQGLNEKRSQHQQHQGRNASLEALQQAALGKNNHKVTQWLAQNHLASKPRLAQGLQANQGWEKALETVLGANLQAICVEGFDPVASLLESVDGDLTLLDISQRTDENTGRLSLPLLLDKVESQWSVKHLLSGVYAANNLTQALQYRSQLAANESIVTAQGLWLSSSWLKVFKGQDEQAGVLEREQELKTLADKMAALKQAISIDDTSLAQYKERLQQYEVEQQSQQELMTMTQDEKSQVLAQIRIKESRIENIQNRLQQLLNEEEECAQQSAQAKTELTKARELWQQAMELMGYHAEQREVLMSQKDDLQQQLQHVRQMARDYRDESHQHNLQLQTLKTEQQAKQNNLSRLSEQVASSQQRQQQLQQNYEASTVPIGQLQQELEETLHRRLSAEESLRVARTKVEELDHQLREKETQRHQAEQTANQVRESLQQKRMDWQAAEVRRNTIQEQMQADDYDLEMTLNDIPEEQTEDTLSETLDSLATKIQRLGAINLAAIDEYESQSERKNYLDKQHDDLMEALETLENAIKKIDKETRQRFKETYDIVNNHFKALFPKIFNGGAAYLELTGDDLLEAGVVVNARPPGKKNSTIHLLSGGEKALTAIALVFSIFQLNPAPFCMLDEVDAPLDDTNVLRYANLVKEMSEKVQFIYISHNKLAIEMAQNLTGVTMKEPGVSRMVSVDIDEAMAMAEA